jgi:hypothetical protein
MAQKRVPTLDSDDKLGFKWLNTNVINVKDKAYGAVGNGTADDTVVIQAAINAVPAAGGVVYFPAGTYRVTTTLLVTRGNITLAGEGMGASTIIAAVTMTGNTPLLQVASTAAAGADKALTLDTVLGITTVTMSTADAATFAVGEDVLLKSNKLTDGESTTKAAGELHSITAINTGTGVVTLNDTVLDTYTLADAAKLTRIPMLRNVTVRDMSFTSAAPSSALSGGGFTRFWFIDNLTISRVEQHHAFHSMEIRSCLNSRIEQSYFHHINDITPAGNLRYGVWIASASQNVTVADCQFSQTRHGITTGGVSGTNLNGIQRNLTFTGCTSMQSDTAHYDVHDPADGVTITGCTAIGGMSYLLAVQAVVGIQVRGRNVVIANNIIRGIPGRGIMIFNAESHGATIIGNNISGITRTYGAPTTGGEGIVLDSAASSRHLISGNTIKDCAHRAISGVGGNDDVVVTGNSIDNCPNALGSGTSINFVNAQRGVIVGNRISNNTTGRWLATTGTSDGFHIADNSVLNTTIANAPSLTGTNNTLHNNGGINPVRSFPLATTTGAITVTRANGHYQYVTLTGNVTLTLTAGLAIGDELILAFTQDATGSRTLAWPSNSRLTGGALALTTAANATDVVTLVWSPGTVWREKSRAMNSSAGGGGPPAGTVLSFTTSTADIANPERGFFQYSETHYASDNTGYVPLSAASLAASKAADSRPLVFRYFVMEKYLSLDTIDSTWLNLVAADLAAIRTAGCRGILRFVYSTSGDMTPPYGADPPLARVLGHIAQIAAVVNVAADVVEAVQAGFIGMWGEWYYTDNFGDVGSPTVQQYADRVSVIGALVSGLDARIPVLLRYPGLKPRCVTAGISAARLGHHNDAFQGTFEDLGTFTTFTTLDATATRQIVVADTGVPVGGESAEVNAPDTLGPAAMAELAALHFTFLNPLYHGGVIASWTSSEKAEIGRRLGHRLRLTTASLPATATAGANMAVSLTFTNDGWAKPLRARPAQLVFVNGATVVTRTLTLDIRTITPGATVVAAQDVVAPAAGSWTMHVLLPDPDAGLAGTPGYAIQLANTGVWSAGTGRNALGHAVVVS